ncbi:MAG: DUF262 domain-containing HNH endonuclease family protein [Campylobacterota bacterium]|nr:DUF262 domain-containing HNH endonuclease family protein [Campylobacterota bacterium]
MLDAYKKNNTQVIKKYKKINIPNYQREYIWGENEWEDFYNDILNIIKLDFKPHFMGTLLLKEKNGYFEVIDGQQRLVTLNIFLMAYRDAYSDRLEFKYTLNLLNDRIEVNDVNNIYDALYNKTYVKGERAITDNESKNIEKAYQYFWKKFQIKGLFGKITTDFNLSRILHKLFFITIEIEETTNPYLIFETLNARGVDLNISDLVKNHLLDLSKEDISLSTFINNEWNNLNNALSQEEFENIFQSFYQSSNNRKKLLKEITVTVNEEDEIKEFLKKLGSYVYMYKKLSDSSNTMWRGDAKWIENVRSIKSYKNNHLFKVITIPLLTSFPKRIRVGAFKFIESLIFRYVIICQKDELKLLEKFYQIAKLINDKSIITIEKLKVELFEYIVDDEEFEYSFAYRSIEYSRTNPDQIVRYILYKLENYITNSNYIIGSSNASIEHIGAHSASNYSIVYRLGNYTLLSKEDNEEAGHKTFAIKRDEFYNNNQFGLTHNATNAIIKSLITYNDWNFENIKKRQVEMSEVAIKVWNI